jgi:hypothetical protein
VSRSFSFSFLFPLFCLVCLLCFSFPFFTGDDLIDFALESLGLTPSSTAPAKLDLIRKGLRFVVERANKDIDVVLAEAKALVTK